MIRRSRGEYVFAVFNTLLMVLLVLLTLYPFMYVVFASLSAPSQIIRHRGLLMRPLGFTAVAYRTVFANPNVVNGYKNTLIYVFAGTAINLALTTFGAYGLSRKKMLLRDPIMIFVVFTMFFSGGLIPLYLLVRNLGLLNSRFALLLPQAIFAWNLIIMRTSFQGIPDSLEESARMDGANDFTILFRIVVPLSMPVIAVMILFYGVYHWNAWFHAMIFLRDRRLFPLQLLLREILVEDRLGDMSVGVTSVDRAAIGKTIKYATIVVATVPILFAYPFLQRFFVKGVMVGSLKG
jgi:putative aldouronate transport system permease protein